MLEQIQKALSKVPFPNLGLWGRDAGTGSGQTYIDEATRQKQHTLETNQALDKFVNLDFPSHITLSIVEDSCVLNCRMCPQFLDEFRYMYKGRRMSMDIIKKVSSQIPKVPGIHIELTGNGDPFQHFQCEEIIRLLRDEHPSAYIMVPTEGIILTEKRMRKLMASGVSHISYSMNAGNRETYKWLCGRDKYEKARSNLRRLIELREEMPVDERPIITTHILGIKENEPDFQSFLDEWKPLLPDGVSVRTFGNWAGIVDGLVTPLDHNQNVDWENRYPCLNPFHYLKLNCEGDYLLCFLDLFCEDTPLGNISELSLRDAWHGPYQEHREKHMQNHFKERLCEKCMVWSLYPNVFDKNGDKFSIKERTGRADTLKSNLSA